MLLPVLIIFVLLLVNAFFVVAEFAIVGVQRSAIDARASRHDRLARLVQGVLDDPRRKDLYIATAQIGITRRQPRPRHVWRARRRRLDPRGRSANPPGRSGSRRTASPASSPSSVLTYFHIVIGEMLPKSLALQSAERIALWLTPPMLWIQTLLYPLVIALNGVANLVLQPVRHPARGAQRRTSTTPPRSCRSSSRSRRSRGR